MIDPYTSFRTAEDGTVVAENDDGAVRIGAKWTTPDVVSTAIRLAVPGGMVDKTGGSALAAPRDESIEELAATVSEDEEPIVPSERHAAAVLDYMVDQGHSAREGETYYFHPPGGESTGLGYAGALYSVADTVESTATAIESIQTAVDEEGVDPEDLDAADPPEAFLEAQDRIGDLDAQREQLSAAADRIRSNGRTIETAVLEQAALDQLEFDAVENLVEAVETLASTVETTGPPEGDGAASERDENTEREDSSRTDS